MGVAMFDPSYGAFAGQAKLYGDLHKLVCEGIDPNGNAVS